ncbi:hypothetical protein L0664_15860 [Octadecabacter sp. G9-8]|uniref:Tox-SHH domain-containing protein n=1 Tax=Octadecabacter dasysiphoniae TaxID=2909341 RepID=A0ABS9CZR0_9RHOB|nr:hypothetical protein [Octadecabacter dasysiphoniae]MCF2872552.1 hypothetical protein [Octadecabacter dasysiphoniae]
MIINFVRQGFRGSLDISATVRGNQEFRAVVRRMTDELGIPHRRARRIAEDMVGWAALRHGDNLIAGRSAMIDDIIAIRSRLDELYATVLNYDTTIRGTERRVAAPRDLDVQLGELAQAYRQLDEQMTQLQLPLYASPYTLGDVGLPRHLLDEIDNAPRSSTSSQTPRTHAEDVRAQTQYDGGFRRRLTGIRYHFVRQADGSYVRSFTDGSTATLRLIDGRYRITTRNRAGTLLSEFSEFDILHTPFGRKPRTSAVMQAHHGMQDSLMASLFSSYGYNRNSVPTMWLRNSRSGSPHGMITNAQHTRGARRRAAAAGTPPPAAGATPPVAAATPPASGVTPPAAAAVTPPVAGTGTPAPSTGMTYSDIRTRAIEDFRLGQVPHHKAVEYLAAFDTYFEATVLPQLRAQGALHLLGTWTPRGGL